MAARPVDEVSTRRLTIVDDRGQVRATLGPAPDGSVELRLYDGEDRTRAELAVAANGVASLTLRDPAGEVRSCLAVSTEGDTRLHLHGTAAVSLHDASGQPRAILGLDEHSGMASLSYDDVSGGCCVLLTEDASGGRLHLFQCDGTGRRIPAGDPAEPENAGRSARDASNRGSNGRVRAGSPRAGICGQGPPDRPLGPRRNAAPLDDRR